MNPKEVFHNTAYSVNYLTISLSLPLKMRMPGFYSPFSGGNIEDILVFLFESCRFSIKYKNTEYEIVKI